MTTFAFGGTYADLYRIFRATGGGVNFSADLAGSSVWDYFDDSPQVNDAIYFAAYTLKGLKLFVGTALAGVDVDLKWEYWRDDGWQELTVNSDGTSGLTATGERFVEFASYFRQKQGTINSVLYGWIRLRLNSFTSISEGGAQSTQKAQYDQYYLYPSGSTAEAPYTAQDVLDYMTANYPHWTSTKSGNQFVFDFLIYSYSQYLKSQNEYIVLGNGNIYDRFYWGYLLAGVKEASGMTRHGSTFYMRSHAYWYPVVNIQSGAKIYDSRMRLGNYLSWYNNLFYPGSGGSGGYFSIAYGEFKDCVLEGGHGQGYNVAPSFENVIIRVSEWIMTGGNPAFNGVSISNPGGNFRFRCYMAGFTLKDFKWDSGAWTLFWIFQTYTAPIFNVINPDPALPDLSGPDYPVSRTIYGLGDIQSFQNYDNTSGFTDQTTEARDSTPDDVNLSGKTGVPEINDAIYIRLSTSTYIWSQCNRIAVTMGSVVNSDNDYIWEKYKSGGWTEMVEGQDVWDLTKVSGKSFGQSGAVYFGMGGEVLTTINGVQGTWVRARATSAGASKPLATKIQQSTYYNAGVSLWRIYEKYTFNLRVSDILDVPVQSATVVMKDKDGTQMFSVQTGVDGSIAEQTVTVKTFKFDPANGEYQGMVCVDQNPMTLTVSKAGFRTYTDKITLDKKTDWEIALGDIRGRLLSMKLEGVTP